MSRFKSYPFLVLARPLGVGFTIDMIKIVGAFSINSANPVSNKQAAEEFRKMFKNSEIHALREKHFPDGDCLLECVPNDRWTF